jgi:hypothetical protein
MAQHATEKSPFLYIIIPVTVLLTLLFVSVNNNAVSAKKRLDGNRPAVAVTVHKTDSLVHDTTSHVGAPAVEAAAPAAHH